MSFCNNFLAQSIRELKKWPYSLVNFSLNAEMTFKIFPHQCLIYDEFDGQLNANCRLERVFFGLRVLRSRTTGFSSG